MQALAYQPSGTATIAKTKSVPIDRNIPLPFPSLDPAPSTSAQAAIPPIAAPKAVNNAVNTAAGPEVSQSNGKPVSTTVPSDEAASVKAGLLSKLPLLIHKNDLLDSCVGPLVLQRNDNGLCLWDLAGQARKTANLILKEFEYVKEEEKLKEKKVWSQCLIAGESRREAAQIVFIWSEDKKACKRATKILKKRLREIGVKGWKLEQRSKPPLVPIGALSLDIMDDNLFERRSIEGLKLWGPRHGGPTLICNTLGGAQTFGTVSGPVRIGGRALYLTSAHVLTRSSPFDQPEAEELLDDDYSTDSDDSSVLSDDIGEGQHNGDRNAPSSGVGPIAVEEVTAHEPSEGPSRTEWHSPLSPAEAPVESEAWIATGRLEEKQWLEDELLVLLGDGQLDYAALVPSLDLWSGEPSSISAAEWFAPQDESGGPPGSPPEDPIMIRTAQRGDLSGRFLANPMSVVKGGSCHSYWVFQPDSNDPTQASSLSNKIRRGDSGALVFGQGQLYGMVIGGDPVSGIAFVVPSYELLADFERRIPPNEVLENASASIAEVVPSANTPSTLRQYLQPSFPGPLPLSDSSLPPKSLSRSDTADTWKAKEKAQDIWKAKEKEHDSTLAKAGSLPYENEKPNLDQSAVEHGPALIPLQKAPHGALRDSFAYSDIVQMVSLDQYNNEVRTTSASVGDLLRNDSISRHFGGRRMIFLETPPRGLGDIEARLCMAFDIPRSFFEQLYHEANGYFAPYEYRQNGRLDRYDTEFRFLCKKVKSSAKSEIKTHEGISYQWEKLGFFTTWTEGSLIVLCFDLNPALAGSITKKFSELAHHVDWGRRNVIGPFDLHHIIVEAMAINFDNAVWQWQKRVRKLETMRPEDPKDKPNYFAMHELSRHVTHNAEGLSTAIMVIREMQDCLRRLSMTEVDHGRAGEYREWSSLAADNGLTKQLTIFNMALNRSRALESRLASEVALVFHTLQAWDSRNSYKVASIAAKDSRAMKTIAILGLVFLPGTFMSAIFSTSFFNFDPDANSWRVSERFWLYWAITLPVTFVVMAIWYAPEITRKAREIFRDKGRELPVRRPEWNDASSEHRWDDFEDRFMRRRTGFRK